MTHPSEGSVDTSQKRVLVAAAVLVENHKIFIAKRKEGHPLSGFWEFPGGKIEPGESPEDCIKREIREEFQMQVNVGTFLSANDYAYREIVIKLIAHWGKPITTPQNLLDHSEYRWVIPGELSSYQLAPADVPIAESIIRQGIPSLYN